RSPVWNQHEPACHSAPTLVTCGLPSAFRVVSQNVERFGACGSSCVRRSASCVSTWDHSIVGSPSASPRFVVFMILETPPVPETHREPVSASISTCQLRRQDTITISAVLGGFRAARKHAGDERGAWREGRPRDGARRLGWGVLMRWL